MTRPETAAGTERGSALVFVLWIALIVSILIAGAAVLARGRLVETRVERVVMQESLALQSALDLVAYRAALSGRSYLEGLPDIIEIAGHTVRVDRAPMNGRIDINLADETALRRLFRGLGASQALSLTLTDQILDWRDTDADPRPFGAEAPDYTGLPGKQIANRAFMTIGELVRVKDISRGRLACMAPYLTVYGGTGPVQGAPPGEIEIPAGIDGVRVALRAAIVTPDGQGRAITGLAQFGASARRPYEWVRMGGDDGALTACPPGAFSQ